MILNLPITPVQPLLAAHAVSRHGESPTPGYFDANFDVWVVDRSGVLSPIVQTHSGLGDTTTLTRVRAEQDDSDIEFGTAASTVTLTAVRAEMDDTDVSCADIFEVTPKIAAQIDYERQTFAVDLFSLSDIRRTSAVLRVQ